jgi:hypothetical protein
MRSRVAHSILGTAVALLVVAPRAHGAVVCVAPPAVAACPNHTIAAAIPLAGAGGTVLVAPGTYYENAIAIPAGYDGLTVSGAGKTATIVDIGNNTALGVTGSTLRGFDIDSQNVTVKGLTIRNGDTGLVSSGAGTIVTRMSFVGQASMGARVEGPGSQVTASEFKFVAIGIRSGGAGNAVRGNTVTDTYVGLQTRGELTQVLLNKFYNGIVGIESLSDRVQIKSNDVRYQSQGIISGGTTQGADPTIQGNRILGTQIGIHVSCPTCAGGLIASNIITDANTYGIQLTTSDPGLVVKANSILRAGPGGIVVSNVPGSVNGVVVTLNRVADSGHRDGSACYRLSGDGNVALNNQASRCAGAGFWAEGSLNRLEANVAVGGFENGIKVDGDGGTNGSTRVVGNRTTGNAGAGIAVVGNAVNTEIKLNTSTLNRSAVCDDTLNGTTFDSNNFPAPGSVIPCDIVH